MTDSVPDSLLVKIEELIEQIQAMNLFNDTFISVVFKDEGACLHLVRQLMQKPDLKIIACRTQDAIPMLISKSPRLDITAEDDQGALSAHVNYLKSPEGGREAMGEFEKIFTEKGRAEGEAKVHRETALEMLKGGEKLSKIVKYSTLAKETVFALAKENGLEVVVS